MSVARSLAVALALVVACAAYVPRRGERGGPALVGDALSYAAMVAGSDDVESPYRFRVIVPRLARALPLEPASALACVSWLSLAATYALILASGRRARIAPHAALLGLLLAAFSPSHLYNYYNPYLTDATGLLIVAIAMYALSSQKYWLFLLASAGGAGVREALLMITPSWSATGQRTRAVVAVATGAAVYLGLRLCIGMNPLLNKGPFVFPARPIAEALLDAILSWQVLWALAAIGLAALRVAARELRAIALLLFAGATLTSLAASDTTRMFQPLFPLVALALGAFVEGALRSAPRTTRLFCFVYLATSWVWQPVRFLALPKGSALERGAQAAALIATCACALAIVLRSGLPRAAGTPNPTTSRQG